MPQCTTVTTIILRIIPTTPVIIPALALFLPDDFNDTAPKITAATPRIIAKYPSTDRAIDAIPRVSPVIASPWPPRPLDTSGIIPPVYYWVYAFSISYE